MRPLREAKCKDAALLEQARRPCLDFLVVAHPDGTESEDRDLPGVPIGEAIEAENLGEFAIPPGIPARIRSAVARRRQGRGEEFLLLHELEEIRVPGLFAVVALERSLPLVLEEFDGLQHDFPGGFVRVVATVVLGVEEDHRGLRGAVGGRVFCSSHSGKSCEIGGAIHPRIRKKTLFFEPFCPIAA